MKTTNFSLQSEIEIKARIYNWDAVLDWLYKNAVKKKKYFKKDIYYAKASLIASNNVDTSDCLRLRLENGGYTFCSKIRSMMDGAEINTERELFVSKHQARYILNFLSKIFDLTEYVRKEKKGFAFSYNGTLIEVSKIKPLGNFIEIELLNSNMSHGESVEYLHEILRRIGIDKQCIEEIPYINLLKNLTSK